MTGRVEGIDIARAFAVFGMVLINFNAAMGGEGSNPSWLTAVFGAIEGRAAALFVILAGVSVSFMTRNALEGPYKISTATSRKKLAKRALFLFALGLSYSEIWPPDILHFYSAYLLVAVMLINAPDRVLWLAALVFIGISALLMYLFDYTTAWDFDAMEYMDFWSMEGMIRHVFFNGYYPVFPWAAFLLMGMWLGRQDLRSEDYRKKMILTGFIVFCLSEAASRGLLALYGISEDLPLPPELDYYLKTTPYPPSIFFVASGASTALMATMASLFIADKYRKALWTLPLVATGRMALTIYVGHVFVGMQILDRMGLLIENQPLAFVLFVSLLFNVAAILFSYYWGKKYGIGPLEWVIRRFSR